MEARGIDVEAELAVAQWNLEIARVGDCVTVRKGFAVNGGYGTGWCVVLAVDGGRCVGFECGGFRSVYGQSAVQTQEEEQGEFPVGLARGKGGSFSGKLVRFPRLISIVGVLY